MTFPADNADAECPLVRWFGTRAAAARFVYQVHRDLLGSWLEGNGATDARRHFSREAILFSARKLAEAAPSAQPIQELARAISNRCKACGIRSAESKRSLTQPLWLWFESTGLVTALLGHVIPAQSDQVYYAAQSIRRRFSLRFRPDLVQAFYRLADILNRGGRNASRNPDYRTLRSQLINQLRTEPCCAKVPAETWVNVFLEAAHLAAAIVPHEYTPTKVRLRPREVDAEFLIAHLFDSPTRIPGLNDLFGGVGLRFNERLCDNTPHHVDEPRRSDDQHVPGRFMLITGVCGTGKSVLSLNLAYDVARLGGVAWYFPLEQTAEECQIVLSSLVRRECESDARVVDTVEGALEYVKSQPPNLGLLALLKLPDSDLQQALATMQDHADVVDRFGASRISGLHLLCIDPVNAVLDADDISPEHIARNRVAELIGGLTRRGYNVVAVLEDRLDGSVPAAYLENLADTVLQLSVDDQDDRLAHGYARRRIEVLKSRYQREQRGRHPFSIRSSTGIHVFPGTPAFRIRNRARSIKFGITSGSSGVPSLDSVLGGKNPVRAGMLMAVQGPVGTYKTQLALAFLRACSANMGAGSNENEGFPTNRQHRRIRNLFVTSGMHESKVQQTARLLQPEAAWTPAPFDTLELPSGFSTAGELLDAIDQKLREMRAQGWHVERIAVDDFGEWSSLNPFVRDDEAFATTLFDYLRRRELAVFATLTRESIEARSSLYTTVIDLADTLLDLQRIEQGGRQKVLLRVLQSYDMQHRVENFELGFGSDQRLQVEQVPSLLRVTEKGGVAVAPLRMLLRSETQLQADYNRRLLEVLKARISISVMVDHLDPLAIRFLGALQRVKTLDEVQIWQLDEFQVAKIDEQSSEFSFAISDEPDSDTSPGSPRRPFHGLINGKRWAWPYYDNLSFLVYRTNSEHGQGLRELLELRGTNGQAHDPLAVWRRLGELCLDDAGRRGPNSVFFDFPKASDENYNSLFLEMLSAATPPRCDDQSRSPVDLVDWLSRAGSKAVQVIECFYDVCHRAHQISAQGKWIAGRRLDSVATQDSTTWGGISVSNDAIVWRHWYTTWMQMIVEMRQMGFDHPGQLRLCELPGGVTTAGEWYLTVPQDSANPTVAQLLIRSLCSPDAELDRFRAGAGLPTRIELYPPVCDDQSNIAEINDRDATLFRELTARAFQRSSISRYQDIAPLLAYSLRRFLECDIPSRMSDFGRADSIDVARPQSVAFLRRLKSVLGRLYGEHRDD